MEDFPDAMRLLQAAVDDEDLVQPYELRQAKFRREPSLQIQPRLPNIDSTQALVSNNR